MRLGRLGPVLAAAGHAAFLVCAAAFAVGAAAGIAALAGRPRRQRPAGLCVTYLTCLLFFLPAFVFGSPYAAVGGMTIAHGLQYLLLVAMIAGGAQLAGRSRLSRAARVALLANVAFIGGAALSSASHLHGAGPAGRLIFGAYLGVVMAHFVIDAGIWRMRDPLARNIAVRHLPYLVPARPARLAAQPAVREPAVAAPAQLVMRLPIDRQPI